MRSTRHILIVAGGLLAGVSAALASDIYRCEGEGPRTLVDSPARCPNGRATRIGGSETAAPPPPPVVVPAPEDRPKRLPKREKRPEPPSAESLRESYFPSQAAPAPAQVPAPTLPETAAAPVPRVPVPPSTPATVCAPLRHDAAALRKCLVEERRKEVRIIATGRLVQVSAAAAELVRYTHTRDGLLAVGRNGRPPAWCEELLGDLLQRRRLEVIDDENAPAPAWVRGSGNELRGAEILDPNYAELDAPGGLVAWGYVTLRWKQQRTLVVRTRPSCVPAGPNSSKAACGAQRYLALDIHDDEMPQACIVTFYSRPYWPQWKDKDVEIKVR